MFGYRAISKKQTGDCKNENGYIEQKTITH